jgi:hypothetical protein
LYKQWALYENTFNIIGNLIYWMLYCFCTFYEWTLIYEKTKYFLHVLCTLLYRITSRCMLTEELSSVPEQYSRFQLATLVVTSIQIFHSCNCWTSARLMKSIEHFPHFNDFIFICCLYRIQKEKNVLRIRKKTFYS